MTLDKIFQSNGADCRSLQNLLKQHNPFKTLEALYLKAGLSKDEASEFQKQPDSISIKNLNKILAYCEFDLKLTALSGDDLNEINISDELSDIYIREEMNWEEEIGFEEELEEGLY